MPADFADEAQQISETFLNRSLANRPRVSPAFSGFCLSCSDPVVARRYCDSSCREAHEKFKRRGASK